MNHTFQSKKKYKKKNQILLPFSNLHSQFIYELANEIIQQHLAKTVILAKPSYLQPPEFPLPDGVKIIR
ncbi:MAG: hypothetical protein LBG59_04490 [Candidatus Peribacteria bacterium]|jgi:hypothetical protein|nr:hypothetical protein [Candidatus Peribacteria bacterium]